MNVFLPGGKYYPMMNDIKEWAVIDFRSDKLQIRASYNRFVHVSYSNDFKHAIMAFSSGGSQQITLIGDEELIKI